MGVINSSSLCDNTTSSQIDKQDIHQLLRLFWHHIHTTHNVLSQQFNAIQIQSIQEKFNSICHQSTNTALMKLDQKSNQVIYYCFDKYLFAGQIKNNLLEGKGIVCFADDRTYIGQFNQGNFYNKGQFIINKYCRSRKVQLKIQTIRQHNQIQLNIKLPDTPKVTLTLSENKIKQSSIKYVKYKNMDEYIGEWKDGHPHGEGRYIYKNGQELNCYPYYQGTFVKGQRDGFGTLFYDSFKFLRIDWSKGRPLGHGQLVVNGYRQRVVFNNGQRIYKKVSQVDVF